MRKSSSLMIAYCVFLLISVIICEAFKCDKIIAISAAVTVAGFVFAFADSAFQISNVNNRYYSCSKEVLEVYSERINVEKSFLQKKISDYEEAISILRPYINNSEIDGIVCDYESVLQDKHYLFEDLESIEDDMNELNIILEKQKASSKKYEIAGNGLMIIGFISFFILAIFEQADQFVISSINKITIYAFSVIMLNYYVKESTDDKYEKEFSKYKGIIE